MRAILGLSLLTLIPLGASAANAPSLPADMAKNSNDLQRAAWACEGGTSSFDRGAAEGRARFFLGTVGSNAARDREPLVLKDGTLSGLGSLSDDNGWSNIRFECRLSADLRRPLAFTFDILSVQDENPPPPPSGQASTTDSAKSWSAEGTAPAVLTHGVPETDDRDFVASCAPGSGEMSVRLTNTLKGLKAGDYITIGMTTGPGSGLYIGRGVMDDNLGAVMPHFTARAKDPLLGWIAYGSSLHVNIGGEAVYDVSLNGSAPAAKGFAAACGMKPAL